MNAFTKCVWNEPTKNKSGKNVTEVMKKKYSQQINVAQKIYKQIWVKNFIALSFKN